jgi:hypothetical protein
MAIQKAIEFVLENKLDKMREEFSNAITVKAVEKLEEKKIELAKSYFGQK